MAFTANDLSEQRNSKHADGSRPVLSPIRPAAGRPLRRPRPTVPATAQSLYGGPSESVGRRGRPGGTLEDHDASGPCHGRLTSRLAAGPQLRAELSLRLDTSHRMNRSRLARTTSEVAALWLARPGRTRVRPVPGNGPPAARAPAGPVCAASEPHGLLLV